MGVLKLSSNNMGNIVKKYIVKEGQILKDGDILSIIGELRNLIAMNEELNYLEDVRENILNLNIYKKQNFNTIIKKDNIDNGLINELTEKFLEIIEEQGLILIIEPNDNIYIDIDYTKLLEVIQENASLESTSVISALKLVQENSIIDSKGNIIKENYKNIYKQISILTDFEKNPITFKYMNGILTHLEKLSKIYSKK